MIIPKKEEIITYVVAKEVDSYNKEHGNSTLSSQSMIGLVDNTAKSLEEIITSVKNLLEQKVQEGVEKTLNPNNGK